MHYCATLLEANNLGEFSDEKVYTNTSLNGITIQATIKHNSLNEAVACIVSILVSNDGKDFFELTSFDLNGQAVASDGFCSNSSWPYYKTKLKSMTPNSSIKVTIGMK